MDIPEHVGAVPSPKIQIRYTNILSYYKKYSDPFWTQTFLILLSLPPLMQKEKQEKNVIQISIWSCFRCSNGRNNRISLICFLLESSLLKKWVIVPVEFGGESFLELIRSGTAWRRLTDWIQKTDFFLLLTLFFE